MSDDATIVLQGDDGKSIPAEILDIFELDGQEYILLRTDDEDDNRTVIMRITRRDGQSVFSVIESDVEYSKVIKYITDLADSYQPPDY